MANPADTRLAEWFRRWHSPLRQFLAGRGRAWPADLDDVAQEVFLRLLRYEKVELVEHPQAYLFKMASNVVAEWAIRSRQRLEHEPHWLNDLVADETPESEFESAAAQGEVRRAIDTLSGRQRAVVRLHFEEGLSYGEIAQRLGVSLRIVRRDFERSYSKLRREIHLERTGARHHGRE